MRPLIVGHSLAKGHDGQQAIVGTRTGDRLAALIGLGDSHALPWHFDLMNVYPFEGQHVETWTRSRREHQALATMRLIECVQRAWVVCLGGGVFRALLPHVAAPPLYEPFPLTLHSESIAHPARVTDWYVAPHTSGRNRYWNDPENHARAERFWRRITKEYL